MRLQYMVVVCVFLIAIALCPLGASAQEAPQGTQSRPVPTSLEEVVVTAEKIKERLLDVSGSLQVLTASTLQDADVTQIGDVVMLTTGLDYAQSFGRQTANAVIRGVAAQFLNDPTVVTLVDGFSLGFTRLINDSLLTDLERIEVLKGPQATLYGFDALGGVINYVTKAPTETPQVYFSGDYGSYQKFKATAAVSGPLLAEDRLYGRLAVASRGSGGTVDNLFDGAKAVNPEHDVVTRGSLRWVATDNLEFNASASYSKTDDGCGDCSHIPSGWNFNNINLLLIGQRQLDWNDDTRTTNMSYLGSYHNKYSEVVLNTQYTQPLFTLTSISGYGDIVSLISGDSSGPLGSTKNGYLVPDAIHGWSEELRAASNEHGRLTWLVGLYAYRSVEAGDTIIFIPGPTSLGRNERTVTDDAAFANADYAISQVLSVTAGVRYDDNKQRVYQTSAFTAPFSGQRSAAAFMPRYSISYKPDDRMNVYATASRGNHAGGFNGATALIPTYDSEFIWNYEVGVKSSFWDKRVQTQLDAFYIDWTNQQLSQSINIPGRRGIGYISNAGKSRIEGAEAALQWAVTDRLSLNGSMTFLDSKYLRYDDPIVAPLFGLSPDLTGKRLPYSPRFASSLSGQYVAPLPFGSAAWEVRLRADVRYTDARFFDPTNLLEANAYWLANLYAGVQNSHLEIGAYADNAFNKGYLRGGMLPDFVFPPEVTLGEPRVFGVRVTARF
jgi:iron complex outermembrane recepter protein